jgi:hypothetical protein
MRDFVNLQKNSLALWSFLLTHTTLIIEEKNQHHLSFFPPGKERNFYFGLLVIGFGFVILDLCFVIWYDDMFKEVVSGFCTFKQLRIHRQAILFLFLCKYSWKNWLRHSPVPNLWLKCSNMRHKNLSLLSHFCEASFISCKIMCLIY